MPPHALDLEHCTTSDDYQTAISKPLLAQETPTVPLVCSTRKLTRVVSFAARTTVLADSTHDAIDVRDIWYNAEEYENMLNDCLNTIAWMKSVSKIDRKEQAEQRQMCTRGLEEMTTSGRLRKMRNTMAAWDAVFEEQERQNMEGIIDPSLLSDIYFHNSFHCLETAFTRAIRDCVESYNQNKSRTIQYC